MWLLINDKRDLNCDVIARTPEAAKKLLFLSNWTCVCFDHDLGTYETGYDLLKWAIKKKLLPKRIQIVTSNPVGRKNMVGALIAEGYSTKDNFNFIKKVTYNK